LNTAHSALATNKINFAQRTLIEGGLAKELDAALSEEGGVGSVRAWGILVNSARCSALTGNAGAVIVGIHQTAALFRRRTTRP